MRDTVDPEFAAYVDARQGRWLRTAYLVYGELERAERAVCTPSPGCTALDQVDDPDVFVQGLLYQPALRGGTGCRPFEDEEDPVKLALADLTPGQRTVLCSCTWRSSPSSRWPRYSACRTPRCTPRHVRLQPVP